MSRLRIVASVVGFIAVLALVQLPVHTQVRDLDLLDDATLQRDLEAELDDIYADFDPNGQFPLEELKAAMLEALSDDGDEDMEEADTTIEDVLDMALAEADAIASSQPQTWSIVRVGVSSSSAAQRRGNGRTTPRQATQQAVRTFIRFSNAK
jgi:hypothetical protein